MEEQEYAYLYAEFIDYSPAASLSTRKDHYLLFVGEPDDDLIEELDLKKDEFGRYISTLNDIGSQGWQLKFVTPCKLENAIENSYIFEKRETYVRLDW